MRVEVGWDMLDSLVFGRCWPSVLYEAVVAPFLTVLPTCHILTLGAFFASFAIHGPPS